MTERVHDVVFNPAALQNLDSSLMDEAEIIEAEEEELRQIVGPEVRRRCASLRLASRIVGMATAINVEVGEEELLQSMQSTMARLNTLRAEVLRHINVERASSDYRAIFNSVTYAMLDVLTEEWKWAKLAPAKTVQLDAEVVARLSQMVMQTQTESFELSSESNNVSAWRHLSLLEIVPKLYGLLNLFDYYQSNREAMVDCLMQAVVEQAEFQANRITSSRDPSFVYNAVSQKMYRISRDLMCDVYREMATRDVTKLREMQPLDRSVMILRYEQIGMKYDHIIEAHRTAMAHVLETTQVILEKRPEPRNFAENSHGDK